jgi:hypothetical protein
MALELKLFRQVSFENNVNPTSIKKLEKKRDKQNVSKAI